MRLPRCAGLLSNNLFERLLRPHLRARNDLLVFFILMFAGINCFGAVSGAKFLEFIGSPRGNAMGEAATTLTGEPSLAAINPASISFAEKSLLSIHHNSYFQGINEDFVSGVLPYRQYTFGFWFSYVKMADEPIYDFLGRDTGTKFSYGGNALSLSFSYLFGSLSLGTNIKSVSENIGTYSASGTGVDIGALYKMDIYKFGLSYQNIGSIDEYKLPLTLRAGISASRNGLTLAADYSSQEIEKNSGINLGAEYIVNDVITPRIGYRIGPAGSNKSGITTGIGFRFKQLLIDYAFVPYQNLGDTHRIELTAAFGPVRNLNPEPAPVSQKTSAEKINLAVTEFAGKNVSAADASIVSDFIRNDLVNFGAFNVMDRANMEMLLAEQKFQSSGCTEQECAVKIGKLLNVRQIVVGSLSKLIDTYYITVNLIDVETGKIIKADKETAMNAAELSAAGRKLAFRLSN